MLEQSYPKQSDEITRKMRFYTTGKKNPERQPSKKLVDNILNNKKIT